MTIGYNTRIRGLHLFRCGPSNTPLEWTGHHRFTADAAMDFLPATQGTRSNN
jgi:hypothetical protein